MQLIGSRLVSLKMLHVPKAVDKKGMLVVPRAPRIDICVLPSRDACNGIKKSPTDRMRRGPAGGKVTVPEMVRSRPIGAMLDFRYIN